MFSVCRVFLVAAAASFYFLLLVKARLPVIDDDPFKADLEDSYSATRYRSDKNNNDENNNNNDDDITAAAIERAHEIWLSAGHDHQGRQNSASEETSREDESAEDESWQADPNVLALYPKLGQVVAVAFNKSDKNLLVFHRGSAVWNEDAFSLNGTYLKADAGPIRDDTIVYYNTKSGTIVKRAGKNMFYMPHGMSIGPNGDIWVTDVALHQVFRLVQTSTAPFLKPELILGEAFQSGSDDRHFCKPTAVVEASDGSIFVADGYCNSRIMKFNGKTGELLAKFGEPTLQPENNDDDVPPEPGTFFIPHSLCLIEHSDLICVADRENKRIQCFGAGLNDNDETGRFVADISHSEFGQIYAVKYAKKTNVLLALSRDSDQNGSNKVFAIDASSGKPFEAISVPGLISGHDLDIDEERGLVIYIGEIGPNKVWRVNRSG